MQLADSLNRLGTETAFEVLARAKALEASGRRIIHLQIGEPDFTTPRHIIDAGRKAWADGETHYCPAPGLPVLREACAAHLSRHRGLEIDPGNVVVAPGAKPFLFFGVRRSARSSTLNAKSRSSVIGSGTGVAPAHLITDS